jgi:hypothetical protein
MRNKKHIDRLFQEGLKDFEATPSDAVWGNIESELNKDKEKRRIIPIWWRYAGVAALLLVFLSLGINTFYNTPEENIKQQEVVDTESTNASGIKNETILNENHINSNTNSAISDNAVQKSNANKESKNTHNNNATNNLNTNKNNAIATTVTVQKTETNKSTFQSSNKTSNIASTNTKEKTQNTTNTDVDNDIARQSSEENNTTNGLITTNKNAVANVANTTQHKNIEETIAKNNNDAPEKTLTIEEALDRANDIIDDKETQPIDRWSLAANAAPVYYNATGKGSSIDPQFSSNSKTGEVNMSYGVTASYAVNKKLSIRSGINRVSLGYNTNDVVSYQSIGVSTSNANALQNVSNTSNNTSISSDFTTNNTSSVQTTLISANNLTQKSASSLLKTSNTSINQSLGYIEVPLELQYALVNRKFGLHVIGGLSSLFLSNNEVFSETQDGSQTYLGEATNLNKISYSANFGLGLKYKMSQKIDLNLEPMLKYQINTFNNTSGDVQPFFIGVYTGLAIKF